MKIKMLMLGLAALTVTSSKAQFTNFQTSGPVNAGTVGTSLILNDGINDNAQAEATAVWNNQRVDFNRSFIINFSMSIVQGSTQTLADGITFTFQNESPTAIRTAGGGFLGVTNHSNGSTGIVNSISAGFDVFNNGSSFGDDSPTNVVNQDEHFELVFNGDLGNPLAYVPINLTGTSHDVAVIWNCSDGLVYLIDGQPVGFVAAQQVLAVLGTSRAYFGFTASSKNSSALMVVADVSLNYGEEVCACSADFDLKMHAESGQPLRISSFGHPVQTGALESYDITSSTSAFSILGSPSFSYLTLPPGQAYKVCRRVIQTDGTECETCLEFCIPSSTQQRTKPASEGANRVTEESLEALDETSELLLMPNPATDQLVLSGLKSPGATGSIFNVAGVLVAEVVFDSTEDHAIDVSALPSGLYVIHIEEGAARHSLKFVKE